jgi:ABC-type transport system involved in cytochrome bd biosynthesis fused ATPase/permease subunit
MLAGELGVYSGSVKIGGTELADIHESSVIRHISLTEHSAFIFKGTIARI